MTYRLNPSCGDTIAVPQLVFHHLARAGGDQVRVALYIVATGCTDPKTIAHDLKLKTVAAAQSAMDFWHGVGLLEKETGATAPPPAEKAPPLTADQRRLAALRDPTVSMLAAEAQTCLGRALGQKEVQRVVSLYVNEGTPAEVILLCAAHNAAEGRCSVAQLERELDRWSQAGVCTGEDAERHLKLLAARRQREQAVAGLLGADPESLTQADKNCVRRWYEEYRFDDAMVAEAALHAGANKSVKYLNGILKSWHGKGWRTPADARGAGGLEGSNIRVDRTSPSGDDILRRASHRRLRLKRED